MRFLSIEPLLEPLGHVDLRGVAWVIVGGESGPGARPMRQEWVVPIRDQCKAADVPFFFKQWGGTRKAKTGRVLEGRTYDEYPVRATASVASPEERRAAIRRIALTPHTFDISVQSISFAAD
jgi:protein gp37